MEAEPGRLAKLQWLCRRGMKELDVLLEGFLARNRAELERGAFPELEELLSCEDDRLWDWIQQKQVPGPAAYGAILTALRRGP
jgi:antitoxin CptB